LTDGRTKRLATHEKNQFGCVFGAGDMVGFAVDTDTLTMRTFINGKVGTGYIVE
jgi:hypothetical protein